MKDGCRSCMYDNDDPYGLKVQYLQGESGPECLIDLRLPNAQRDYFCGRFPIEVWKYEKQ